MASFYLRNGFYFKPIDSPAAFLASACRPLFLACVPLFLILTGYFKCGHEWDRRYFHSLLPILISWTAISGIHLIYKILFLQEKNSILVWIVEYLGFKLANYSWYIGMYLALMIVSPMLNLLWRSCTSRRQHQIVLLAFFAVTFLPSTVNHIAHFAGAGNDLLPGYFANGFYLSYYMIGGYIRTYRPQVRPLPCLLTAFATDAFLAAANTLTRAKAPEYYSGYYIDYPHLCTAVIAVALFLACYRLTCSREMIRRAAARISTVILEMYLISWIFDTNIYTFHKGTYSMWYYLPVGLAMTAAVFLLSYLSGSLIHTFTALLLKTLQRQEGRTSTSGSEAE